MTAAPAVSNASIRHGRRRPARSDASVAVVPAEAIPFERARLSCRLRRVLTDNPNVRHFTVQSIVKALGSGDAAPSVALFAAAGVLESHRPGRDRRGRPADPGEEDASP